MPGNLESRGADAFVWDAEDRLLSATVDSATTAFTYNGDGLRDSLTYDSSTTTFTWDVSRSIAQVLDDEAYQYVYGLGRIAQVDGSDASYYLTDGLGSTMALTDADGDVDTTWDYDVFGAVRGMTGSQENDFTFAGEQVDGSTGLQYLRARYYDAEVGRFVSRDRFPGIPGMPLSLNAYPYVLNNPINLLDPSGKCVFGAPCPGSVKKAAEAVTNKAEDVARGIVQTAEAAAYGGYFVSYEALNALGSLPDEYELLALGPEILLTVQEAGFLAVSASLDYIATGNYTNVNYNPQTGERLQSDIWPDPFLELLGIDPTSCYEPCGYLPGIGERPGKEGGLSIDFQWPLGN